MFHHLSGSDNRAHHFEEVTPWQLEQERKSSEQALIPGVCEPYEYAQGHIPGSKLIPLGQFTRRPSEVGSKEQELIMVCRRGQALSNWPGWAIKSA